MKWGVIISSIWFVLSLIVFALELVIVVLPSSLPHEVKTVAVIGLFGALMSLLGAGYFLINSSNDEP